MPGGHDTTIEVSNIMSFVLYTQILKQSVLKPASQGITLRPMSRFLNFKVKVIRLRVTLSMEKYELVILYACLILSTSLH